MGVCNGMSALHLVAVGVSLLLAVLCLEIFWVRIPEKLAKTRPGADAEAAGPAQSVRGGWRAAASVMLLVWVSACGA